MERKENWLNPFVYHHKILYWKEGKVYFEWIENVIRVEVKQRRSFLFLTTISDPVQTNFPLYVIYNHYHHLGLEQANQHDLFNLRHIVSYDPVECYVYLTQNHQVGIVGEHRKSFRKKLNLKKDCPQLDEFGRMRPASGQLSFMFK